MKIGIREPNLSKMCSNYRYFYHIVHVDIYHFIYILYLVRASVLLCAVNDKRYGRDVERSDTSLQKIFEQVKNSIAWSRCSE